jgi:cathepsin L
LFGSVFGLQWDHEFSSAELAQENMHGLFQEWRFTNKKVYDSLEEEMRRFGIFEYNMERIAASNDEFRTGTKTYTLRMNHFGDMTDEEFHEYYNCPATKQIKAEVKRMINEGSSSDETDATLPEGATVDWNAAGYVTPVKNQGQCGSCWAFSATGSMECQHAIQHSQKPPTSLSEQQLVDCSGAYGNQGCNGGWYYDAWKYAESAGGLCTESEYPYTARDGTCKASSCGTKYYKPTGYSAVSSDNESALQNAVNKGCVSVAIEADQMSFQYYSGGVLTGSCGTRIDHAVLAVGYGTLNGDGYWLVKNSWGTGWGVNGYVYICKGCGDNGTKGECGINMYPYQVSE